MRTVFLGSPPFATPVLERLVDSPERPVAVITPPDRRRGRGRQVQQSPIAVFATEHGLALLQPPSVRDEDFLVELAALEADVFLVVSYGELLRQSFLDLPRLACLNIHPSLLPRHRGATPIQAAIQAGDEETGVSIQRVVLELDAGDVLAACSTAILPDETAGELGARLAVLSGDLAVEALASLRDGTARFVPQDPDKVTFCRKLTKESGFIDWSSSAAEIERHVRAMNPWPVAQTSLPEAAGGSGLAVWRAHIVPLPAGEKMGRPGALLQTRGRLVVATGEGALELDEIQQAGKRRMAASEYCLGARLEPGQELGQEPSREMG